jgi:23S rRNA pseudouridine955/2504/2580 synthase
MTQYTAGPDDDNRRLDRILRKAFPALPLSAIHRLLRRGSVLVDGRRGEAASRVRAGSVIEAPGADLPDAIHPSAQHAMPTLTVPGILWEGAGLLILNKPAGLAAHGPASLEDGVRAYLKDKLPPSLSFRPGPLHRLDKPTSGVIAFSASLDGARRVSALLREGRIRKRYIAIVEGALDEEADWEDLLVRDPEARKTRVPAGEPPVSAREARTRVSPLATIETRNTLRVYGAYALQDAAAYTLIEAELYTGRTHQIRAQAAAHGYPLAGDRKYGGHFMEGGFLLHARALEIPALPGLDAPLIVKAPLPERFQGVIASLFGENILENIP